MCGAKSGSGASGRQTTIISLAGQVRQFFMPDDGNHAPTLEAELLQKRFPGLPLCRRIHSRLSRRIRTELLQERLPRFSLSRSVDGQRVLVADELHDDSCIGDATWAALAERYDEHQLIEVPMVVGHYHLVSFTLNSLGVPLEDGAQGFPSEEG